jgi:hypothetical protein
LIPAKDTTKTEIMANSASAAADGMQGQNRGRHKNAGKSGHATKDLQTWNPFLGKAKHGNRNRSKGRHCIQMRITCKTCMGIDRPCPHWECSFADAAFSKIVFSYFGVECRKLIA